MNSNSTVSAVLEVGGDQVGAHVGLRILNGWPTAGELLRAYQRIALIT